MLPNDRDSIAAAEAAARTVREAGDVRVAVIRTDAQVQGLAALAVHEPGRTFEEDIVEMSAAARHARAGAVTVAVAAGDDHGRARASRATCSAWSRATSSLVGDDLFEVATRRPRAAARRWRRAGDGRRRAPTAGDLAAALRVVPPRAPTPTVDVVGLRRRAGGATRCSSVSSRSIGG